MNKRRRGCIPLEQDVIIIGAGLSGLTAGALLAKRNQKVLLLDQADNPGGTCGSFKRKDILYDQGTAMLFGFGESGFNPHKRVFDIIEEPIDVIRHDVMYVINFKGKRIIFYTDMNRFLDELCSAFPKEEKNLRKFYKDLSKLYTDVIEANPPFTTPDESDFSQYAIGAKQNPKSYLKFMSFMFRNTGSLLKKYFKDPEVIQFFDKLCSTYCYTPANDTPAVLGAVMFIENHKGGSFYPAGGSMFLPGKLEKVIEENNGVVQMRAKVQQIIFKEDKPVGVQLADGICHYAKYIIYSGNIWDLYQKLLGTHASLSKKRWVKSLVPTLPSCIVNMKVKRQVIPSYALATEMLAENPQSLNEDEMTVYISTIDDYTLAEGNVHTVTAIVPTFSNWENLTKEDYQKRKKEVLENVIKTINRQFDGFSDGVLYATVATPKTLERYCAKYKGAAAGPMQKMGQHMLKRQHIRTEWNNLFCCGESTVMGTGTPAVTISGVAAASAVLKQCNLPPILSSDAQRNYVNSVVAPYTKEQQYERSSKERQELFRKAAKCNYCEKPQCTKGCHTPDIPGIMRRLTVENMQGAYKKALEGNLFTADIKELEKNCIRNGWAQAVEIENIINLLEKLVNTNLRKNGDEKEN